LALQAADISATWKNNGLGTGFASYCNICDYDSFSRFGGDSRIHRSARLASYQLSLLSMYLLN
jgi:hypothetical protein